MGLDSSSGGAQGGVFNGVPSSPARPQLQQPVPPPLPPGMGPPPKMGGAAPGGFGAYAMGMGAGGPPAFGAAPKPPSPGRLPHQQPPPPPGPPPRPSGVAGGGVPSPGRPVASSSSSAAAAAAGAPTLSSSPFPMTNQRPSPAPPKPHPLHQVGHMLANEETRIQCIASQTSCLIPCHLLSAHHSTRPPASPASPLPCPWPLPRLRPPPPLLLVPLRGWGRRVPPRAVRPRPSGPP